MVKPHSSINSNQLNDYAVRLELIDQYEHHLGGFNDEENFWPEDLDPCQSGQLESRINEIATTYDGKYSRSLSERKLSKLHSDGGITTSVLEILTLSFASLFFLADFLKIVQPILVQWIKNRKTRRITLKKGDIEIEITGTNDIIKAIAILEKLEPANLSAAKNKQQTLIAHTLEKTAEKPTVKILFLAANPKDIVQLKLNEELRAIDRVLREVNFRNKFDIEPHLAVRVTDLQTLLLRYEPDIVHFSGHGSPSSEIILEHANGDSQIVSTTALSNLFRIFKEKIQCVVLNACYSECQAQSIAKYINCVIGMSTAIEDQAAIKFACAFYQALGYGKNVKTAFELGKSQIDLAGLGEKEIPQLITKKRKKADRIAFV